MCNDVDLVFQLYRQYNIIFITYLLKPRETTVFCRPSTAVVATTLVSGPQNTLFPSVSYMPIQKSKTW